MEHYFRKSDISYAQLGEIVNRVVKDNLIKLYNMPITINQYEQEEIEYKLGNTSFYIRTRYYNQYSTLFVDSIIGSQTMRKTDFTNDADFLETFERICKESLENNVEYYKYNLSLILYDNEGTCTLEEFKTILDKSYYDYRYNHKIFYNKNTFILLCEKNKIISNATKDEILNLL